MQPIIHACAHLSTLGGLHFRSNILQEMRRQKTTARGQHRGTWKEPGKDEEFSFLAGRYIQLHAEGTYQHTILNYDFSLHATIQPYYTLLTLFPAPQSCKACSVTSLFLFSKYRRCLVLLFHLFTPFISFHSLGPFSSSPPTPRTHT